MATTVDRLFACVQICSRLSTLANNFRSGVSTIGDGFHGNIPGSILSGNLDLTRSAFLDLASALESSGSGLGAIDAVVSSYPSVITQGLAALGVSSSDVDGLRSELRTGITRLRTTPITASSDIDTLIASVLLGVPASLQVIV